jgi:futalosine hydrolase
MLRGYGGEVILVVAATDDELRGAGGARALACGVGPVEAAARTAAELAREPVDAVLHVGIAGAREFAAPSIVIGSEAVYEDADDPQWIALRIAADKRLVAAAQGAFPEARIAPIGTTARIAGASECDVEAMEGYAVLRAAALAGVPAVEVRVLSNAVSDAQSHWQFDEAFALLAASLPRLIEAVEHA